jgi:hypothetical protein
MQRLRVVTAALASATLLSCGGGGDTTAPPTLTTVNVSVSPNTFAVGQSATATAHGLDQNGASIAIGAVTWSTESSAIATVNSSGVVVGVSPASTFVIATVGDKQGKASVLVILPPVATVTVSPAIASLAIGATQQLTANTLDGSGNPLTGRQVTWASSNGRATVSSTGLVTGVAAGAVAITATSEGAPGSSLILVGQPPCTTNAALQFSVGAIHTLTASERLSLCLGGGTSASEYVLIPFNNSTVAAVTTPVSIAGVNTSAIGPGQLASLQPPTTSRFASLKQSPTTSFEWAFRERERQDLTPVLTSMRQSTRGRFVPRNLTAIPPQPTVGSVVQINANLTGNSCTAPKQLHSATVVAVLTHTIVLSDNQSPTGGYTTAEMTSLGDAFDTEGWDLDVLNFGAPSDMDQNGRIAILFTPSVNALQGPPGATVGGLFAGRDLAPATGTMVSDHCVASNEGEMFYVPVPDPSKTINANYTDKAGLMKDNLGTLVHEFQHLINAGRRMYVNNASSFEEVWLNEGLSHIAEELIYYRKSGNSPRSNIDITLIRSTAAQLDAANTYQINNIGRLITYMQAPEANSPFSMADGLQMRGAIWQLLRYSADRKGGAEQNTWSALVNSTAAGQANFNAVFGDIITLTRDWAVAQFTDDAGLSVAANYTHPSWNFRSILPPVFKVNNQETFPLLTHPLLDKPVDVQLAGGGAGYVRFLVGANAPAIVYALSAGQDVPATIDFILVRTK